MPVNANGQPSAHPPQKPQKSAKAERREQQRAAKEAKQTGTQPPGSTPGSKVPSTPVSSSTPRKAAGKTTDILPMGDNREDKSHGLRIFSHFGLPKQISTSVKGDIHPAVVRLGLQFSEFKICGANARCIATLTAIKAVIQDYTTPHNSTLSRHLMTHLSAQISHLVAARPMSVTMGNAIRQLKLEISGSDIDMPEQDAKDLLCRKIDNYIRDRIVIADQVIQDLIGRKIKDGDVIMTYARSSVVEKVLLASYAGGKKISVIVVDSRPMLEGKKLLLSLSSAGISCTYLLLPAIGAVIAEVSTVFLGAHSLHSNGAVFSRAGTALVAMMATQHSVPVVVCCETYKFSDSIQLDSFTKNELAPGNHPFSSFPSDLRRNSSPLRGGPNLEILHPLYDLTPPSNITVVVTEVGLIPPNSISSIPLALGRQTL